MRAHDKASGSAGRRLDDRKDAGALRATPAAAGAIGAAGVAAPPLSDALARRVAASLSHDDRLAAALIAGGLDPACYEASVRRGPSGELSAGRMMLERASPDILHAIAQALGVTLPPVATRWLTLARREGLPLIAGWDRRGGRQQRCVKLYVNASDASRKIRARLCAALAPGVAQGAEPPAVVGMNARADGVAETKLYMQSADALALANGVDARASALATAARGEGAAAGGVLSCDAADGVLRPRAFFVALREPNQGVDWRCVRSLPGYDAPVIASLLPFSPAPPRSVGISFPDGAWTVYCKPRDSGRAPEALEPAAIFRAGDAEVGVFVEPTEHAARAFRRTDRHAISIRARDGAASPHALESLVDWFTDRLRAAERDGAPIATRLANPPDPWRIVAATRPTGDAGVPS